MFIYSNNSFYHEISSLLLSLPECESIIKLNKKNIYSFRSSLERIKYINFEAMFVQNYDLFF